MTPKSDAQLDAESRPCQDCGRSHRRCLFCRDWHEHDLEARLACHRGGMLDDSYLRRLTSVQPPLTRYEAEDDKGLIRYGADEEFVIEMGAIVGMPMSGELLRRLAFSPGGRYPWVTSFGWLRRWCQLHHRDHRSDERPYWRGALCWEFVKLTMIGAEKSYGVSGPLTISQAASLLRVDQIQDLLGGALDDIERHILWIEERAEKRAREDEGHGPGAVPRYVTEQRHDQPGMHRIDCPQCKREDAA